MTREELHILIRVVETLLRRVLCNICSYTMLEAVVQFNVRANKSERKIQIKMGKQKIKLSSISRLKKLRYRHNCEISCSDRQLKAYLALGRQYLTQWQRITYKKALKLHIPLYVVFSESSGPSIVQKPQIKYKIRQKIVSSEKLDYDIYLDLPKQQALARSLFVYEKFCHYAIEPSTIASCAYRYTVNLLQLQEKLVNDLKYHTTQIGQIMRQ